MDKNNSNNIKNKEAYFRALVKNSNKNEYRANDNAGKYLFYVGDELNKLADSEQNNNIFYSSIEDEISELNEENWLLFMENKKLHNALRKLKKSDLEFLFLAFSMNLTQTELGKIYNVSQIAILKRLQKLFNEIKRYL